MFNSWFVVISRQSVIIPQVEDVAEEAPVSDLLGSILSGQSLLLMDSSDVVINRDGSLKATKSGKSCIGGFYVSYHYYYWLLVQFNTEFGFAVYTTEH